MAIIAGKLWYSKIQAEQKVSNVSSINILNYLFTKLASLITSITTINEFNLLKNQHIIKYDNLYYKKNNNNDYIYNICSNYDSIDMNNNLATTVPCIEIKNIDIIKLKYLKPCILTIKQDTQLYHGTGYQMPIESDHSPYNMYGNWYEFPYIIGKTLNYDVKKFKAVGESKAYAYSGDYKKPVAPRIYTYKVIKDFNILYIETETGIEYLFAHVMFMPILIKDNTIQITTSKTMGKLFGPNDIDLEKYNYTESKNIIDSTKLIPQFGLYNKDGTYINQSFSIPLKLASSGDGDKPLASEICDILHNGLSTYNLSISGWVIGSINHLMYCGKIGYIENISAVGKDSDFNKVTNKGDPTYNAYYKKYIKYKIKYLNLQKQYK